MEPFVIPCVYSVFYVVTSIYLPVALFCTLTWLSLCDVSMSLHRSFHDPCMSRLQEEGKYRVTFLYYICFFTENSNQMCWEKTGNFYTWAYNIHAIKFQCNKCIPDSMGSLIFLWISFITKSEFVRQLVRHFSCLLLSLLPWAVDTSWATWIYQKRLHALLESTSNIQDIF